MNTPNLPPPGQYGPPPGGRPPDRPARPPQYGPGGRRLPGPPPPAAPGRPYGPPPGSPGHGPGPGGPGPGPVPGPGYGHGYGGPPGVPPYGRPAGPLPGPPPQPLPSDFAERELPAGPPSAKPRNSNLLKAAALVVLLVVVATVVFFLQSSEPSSAAVGDCIKVNSVADADIEKVDCASADARYKVAISKDDAAAKCPDPLYLAYTETGSGDLLLCLTLNTKSGECFQVTGNTFVKVDCGAPEALFQVSDVIDGKADAAQCGEAADKSLVYPEPPLTICTVPAGSTT